VRRGDGADRARWDLSCPPRSPHLRETARHAKDARHTAHKPEVTGSNPAPLLLLSAGQGPFLAGRGPFCVSETVVKRVAATARRRDEGDAMARDETTWTWWTLPPAIAGYLAQRYRKCILLSSHSRRTSRNVRTRSAWQPGASGTDSASQARPRCFLCSVRSANSSQSRKSRPARAAGTRSTSRSLCTAVCAAPLPYRIWMSSLRGSRCRSANCGTGCLRLPRGLEYQAQSSSGRGDGGEVGAGTGARRRVESHHLVLVHGVSGHLAAVP
jgi:hypothetical protein